MPPATAKACRIRRGSASALVRLPGSTCSVRSTGSINAAPISTNGTSPRNTQRQLSCWVIVPEITGPMSAGRIQADEIAANSFGRSSSG